MKGGNICLPIVLIGMLVLAIFGFAIGLYFIGKTTCSKREHPCPVCPKKPTCPTIPGSCINQWDPNDHKWGFWKTNSRGWYPFPSKDSPSYCGWRGNSSPPADDSKLDKNAPFSLSAAGKNPSYWTCTNHDGTQRFGDKKSPKWAGSDKQQCDFRAKKV